MDISSLLLQGAFYLLFAVTLVAFIRRPGPLALDILLMFAALAGLFAFQFMRLLFPAAADLIGLAGLALLLAQPGLALRLTRHLSDLPRWVGPAMGAGYLAVLGALVAFGTAQPWVLWLALAYFLVGDGLASALLFREAARRAGFARWRIRLAALAMALIALAILVAVAAPTGGGLARLVALLSAVAFLLAFFPPRPLRQLGQQAVAYRFLRDLSQIGAGSGTARLWQQFVDTAISLTGAVGADVRTGDSGSDPIASAGASNGLARSVTSVAFATDSGQGELRLRSRGPVLFSDDDLDLLALLGRQTLAAVERETVLTERTALGQRIAATNVELARASAAKSDFLAAMSHELRTPLNAIIGFSELLLTPPAPLTDGATKEYAGHIHGAGQHLLDLINDILDLSRVEAGRLELRYEDADVARLLSETIGTVRPLVEMKGLVIDTQVPDQLSASIDAARVRQIAYNLLSNAIKFTPTGGTVGVALEKETATDAFVLTVSDTGPGIAPEDQDRIFAAFEQLSPGSGEGTGLGLALTRRLAEAHGGRIELDSSPGTGSRFSVTMPLQRAELTEATAVEAQPGDAPLVLVIEDDTTAAELLRVQLGQAGYRVAVAVDGESGLRAAEDLAPAAILLDILLPGLDGWEVLRRLRGDPATRSIPVMVITIVDNASLGLALGAVDYFVKPVSRDALLGALSRFTLTSKVRQRTVTVLTIDDDPAALALYRDSLGPEGFRVIEADSGEEGLAQARSGSVDAIVLDLLLPDTDGFAVAAELKRDPATSSIPIIVVTGRELTDADKERLNQHALAVLAKDDEAINGLRGWLDQVRKSR